MSKRTGVTSSSERITDQPGWNEIKSLLERIDPQSVRAAELITKEIMGEDDSASSENEEDEEIEGPTPVGAGAAGPGRAAVAADPSTTNGETAFSLETAEALLKQIAEQAGVSDTLDRLKKETILAVANSDIRVDEDEEEDEEVVVEEEEEDEELAETQPVGEDDKLTRQPSVLTSRQL